MHPKFLIFTLLLAWLCTPHISLAQSDTDTSVEQETTTIRKSRYSKRDSFQLLKPKHKYKHEIANSITGIGLNRLISSSSIMYRKSRKKDGKYPAKARYNTRYALALDGQYNFTPINREDTITNSGVDAINSLFFRAVIGFEKQTQLDKIIFYRGMDYFLEGFLRNEDIAERSVNGIEANFISTDNYAEEQLGVGVIPFLGLRYFISRRIAISAETGWEFRAFYFNHVFLRDQEFNNASIGLTSRFLGLRTVQLSYLF